MNLYRNVMKELLLYNEKKAQIVDKKFEIEEISDADVLKNISYEEKVQSSKHKVENDILLERKEKLLKEIRALERRVKRVDDIIDLVLNTKEKDIIEMTYKKKLSSAHAEIKYEVTYHQIRNIKLNALRKLEPYFN